MLNKVMEMKAVVLAGGKGTRLRPFTFSKPKALISIANKPIIQHIFEDLERAGVDEVFIVTSYLEDRLRSFVASIPTSMSVRFLHQERIGGTGDALKCASGKIDDDFLVVNGDEIFSRGTFSRIIQKFYRSPALGVVGVFKSEHPERYGVVITGEDGVMEGLIEKSRNPPSDTVNAGVYMFSPKIFGYLDRIGLSERGEYELTDAIRCMAEETGSVFACEITGWHGVSELWDIFDANEMKVEESLEEANAGNVLMGDNVVIKPGVHIEGNVVVGDGSVIGPNCYIRGCTSIGRNCHIGNGVEIKNSIIMDNSNVPHLSYVGDSVIGENCNLGAGTITANLRHDNCEVKVMTKGKIADSGKRKLGMFMGDFTKTGVGSVVYPGMVLGPYSWTAPNTTVDCNVEPFTILGSGGKSKIQVSKAESAMKTEWNRMVLRDTYEKLKDLKY